MFVNAIARQKSQRYGVRMELDQSLVLVNGIRMNNMQTGHHNMNLPIPLALIERIETFTVVLRAYMV